MKSVDLILESPRSTIQHFSTMKKNYYFWICSTNQTRLEPFLTIYSTHTKLYNYSIFDSSWSLSNISFLTMLTSKGTKFIRNFFPCLLRGSKTYKFVLELSDANHFWFRKILKSWSPNFSILNVLQMPKQKFWFTFPLTNVFRSAA